MFDGDVRESYNNEIVDRDPWESYYDKDYPLFQLPIEREYIFHGYDMSFAIPEDIRSVLKHNHWPAWEIEDEALRFESLRFTIDQCVLIGYISTKKFDVSSPSMLSVLQIEVIDFHGFECALKNMIECDKITLGGRDIWRSDTLDMLHDKDPDFWGWRVWVALWRLGFTPDVLCSSVYLRARKYKLGFSHIFSQIKTWKFTGRVVSPFVWNFTRLSDATTGKWKFSASKTHSKFYRSWMNNECCSLVETDLMWKCDLCKCTVHSLSEHKNVCNNFPFSRQTYRPKVRFAPYMKMPRAKTSKTDVPADVPSTGIEMSTDTSAYRLHVEDVFPPLEKSQYAWDFKDMGVDEAQELMREPFNCNIY